MCDIDNLYVIYEYNIYYKGKIVTKEVLNESHCNALVLPVYSGGSVSNLANIWNHILLNNKCKERVDVTLKCLTSRYVLIDKDKLAKVKDELDKAAESSVVEIV